MRLTFSLFCSLKLSLSDLYNLALPHVQVNLIEFECTSTVRHADIRPKYALCGLYNVQFISEGILISVGGWC